MDYHIFWCMSGFGFFLFFFTLNKIFHPGPVPEARSPPGTPEASQRALLLLLWKSVLAASAFSLEPYVSFSALCYLSNLEKVGKSRLWLAVLVRVPK